MTSEVDTRVVAPVPWFPFSGINFGEYGLFAKTPAYEKRNGIEVYHPRYFLPPRVGMNIAPHTLAAGSLPLIRKLICDGFDFDLIDAHYYYPDGVAASIIARQIGKPFIVTARGTDLNLIPQYKRPRKLILETADSAQGSIGVCKALMDTLADLGADHSKLHVFRNGVDLERFRPEDVNLARQRLGLPNKQTILLTVGHLVERKGHHIAIEALASLPTNTILTIIGEGPERDALTSLTSKLGLADRVRFCGQVDNAELRWWYSAADALILCSSREGWANVLLESMACGTPVIATNIWGTPEIVTSMEFGRLLNSRDAAALCTALYSLLRNYPNRSAIRKHAENHSWTDTSNRQVTLFRNILASQDNALTQGTKLDA